VEENGEMGRGGGFHKLPQIAFSGERGAIQEVIHSLEKNEYLLRRRNCGYGKPTSSGWTEAQGAVGREQSSPPRSPVILANHVCTGRGLWHTAGSTTCRG